jgi:hypothetical protein
MNNTEPRQLTDEEIREAFLAHVRFIVRWWANNPASASVEERLSGLAHSILSAIDGAAVDLPGFALVPRPHPEDKEYYQEKGEDWYPEANLEHDIAGSLHELFYKS